MIAPLRHALRAATVVGVLAVAVGTTPPAAQAHPFGAPQSATVSASPTGVRVLWQAAPDDVTALAAHLGVVGGSHIVVFDDGEYDAEESSVSGGVRLAEEAAVLSDYLLAHVEVSAAGATCAGELEPGTDVTSEGATLAFDCGGPVAVADVRISTLTDLDPAYRTLAEGPGGQRQSYSLDRDSFAWELPAPTAGRSPGSLEPPGSSGRSAAVQLGAITAVGVAIGAGAWMVRRRRVDVS